MSVYVDVILKEGGTVGRPGAGLEEHGVVQRQVQRRRRHEEVAQQKLRLQTVHHARARRRRVPLRTARQNVSRYVSRYEPRAVTVS